MTNQHFPSYQHFILFLPGLYVIKQMLPAVVDVLKLIIDICLLGLVAGGDELLSELLQVGLILTEQVDLLHAVLLRKEATSRNGHAPDLCSVN